MKRAHSWKTFCNMSVHIHGKRFVICQAPFYQIWQMYFTTSIPVRDPENCYICD
jgi:hypothetical protein